MQHEYYQFIASFYSSWIPCGSELRRKIRTQFETRTTKNTVLTKQSHEPKRVRLLHAISSRPGLSSRPTRTLASDTANGKFLSYWPILIHGSPYRQNKFPCDLVTHCHPAFTNISLGDFIRTVSASWLSHRNSTSVSLTLFNGTVYGSIIRGFCLRNFLHSRLVLDCMSELQSRCIMAVTDFHEKCQRPTSETRIIRYYITR